VRATRLRSGPIPMAAHRQARTQRAGLVRTSTRMVAERPPVLDEELFRGVLVRECRRADRSNQPFALMLLTITGRVDARPSTWAAAIEALTSSKRETDVVGWLSGGAVLGVILSEIASRDSAVVGRIEGRVRRQLAARLTADAASSVSIQLHVHPEIANEEEHALAPVDPLLEDLHRRHPRTTLYGAVKRAMDVAGSGALLIMFAPLFLLIAILIKLGSTGPVFFRQPRIGQRAKPFTMLKFRTMYSNIDHALHHEFVTRFIKSSADVHEPVEDAPFKIANDPRVTPLGRMLRRTSLDELPQLWNALRGEMSLVGPRPPISYEVAQYQSWHRRRILEVKPGITGLWQVTGRSRTTFDEMVRLDIRYARTCSLWTDIKILLATPLAAISGKGAC
jgi:lipopolysaccharide/colanic/teichoic acid biosynthesis glycosyltransferase